MDDKLQRELNIQRRHAAILQRGLFWPWFWSQGARTFVDKWLLAHLGIGFTLAACIRGKLSDIAVPASIPFVAILVGLAVAWSGNANALLQTAELQQAGAGEDNSFAAYRKWVFQYQAAVLVILASTITWSLAAAGIFNWYIVSIAPPEVRIVGRALVFGFSCMTVRECWQVVAAAQMMLIARLEVVQRRIEIQEKMRAKQAPRLPGACEQ